MTTPELLALYEVSSVEEQSVLAVELFTRLNHASLHPGRDVNAFSPKYDR
jgi:hypothetical protein